MAQDPRNFRDPEIPSKKNAYGNAVGMWIGFALGVLIVFMLLAWLFGLFIGDVETSPIPTVGGGVGENSE